MDTKQDRFFVLELIDFVFQVVGKPLPCNLQRKLDKYSRMEDSNLTLCIRKAAMVYINGRLISNEIDADVASKQYDTLLNKLLKKYSTGEFLKFISHFAYGSVMEYLNQKPNSPEIFFNSVVKFLENLRKKGQIDNDFWKNLDQFAVTVIMDDLKKNNFKSLRKTDPELDMSSEKGFVLKIMYFVFDFCCCDLPPYLRMEYDEYTKSSSSDSKIKNTVYVILNEVGKKIKLCGGIEPIVLHYYNLSGFHFTQKYFLEFCVCASKNALLEYLHEDKEGSPKTAYELSVYILTLAKEDGKFKSLKEMNDAATNILDDDCDRIEHARARNAYIEESSGSMRRDANSGTRRKTAKDCRCCTLH